MLQPAGDLGLEQEPLAADRVVGVLVEDLLERDLAVQLGVERDEDGAQAAPGVRPQDAEPLAVGGGGADRRVTVRSRSPPASGRRPVASVASERFDLGDRRAGQALARRAPGRLTAARLFSTSPPCFLRCRATMASNNGAVDRRRGRRGRRGARPAVGPCRGSRPGRRRRAGPGRSGRSAGRAGRRAGLARDRAVVDTVVSSFVEAAHAGCLAGSRHQAQWLPTAIITASGRTIADGC